MATVAHKGIILHTKQGNFCQSWHKIQGAEQGRKGMTASNTLVVSTTGKQSSFHYIILPGQIILNLYFKIQQTSGTKGEHGKKTEKMQE